MKKNARKLALKAQSIRTLAAADLGAIAAGCDTGSNATDKGVGSGLSDNCPPIDSPK